MKDPYLSEKEASELTGMSISWLQKARTSNSGPVYIKLSGAVKYKESDLRAWFDSRRVQTGYDNSRCKILGYKNGLSIVPVAKFHIKGGNGRWETFAEYKCPNCFEKHRTPTGAELCKQVKDVSRAIGKEGELKLLLVDPVHCRSDARPYYLNPHICIEQESNA